MKLRGIITKSAGLYTATVKFGTETLFKMTQISSLVAAQEILKSGKAKVSGTEEYVKSFPDLEGKTIRFETMRNVYKGKVVGCDYHIGITIVDAEDKNHYLTCIRGPLSVQGKKILKDNPEKYNVYSSLFAEAVKAIQNGAYVTYQVTDRAGSPKAGSDVGSHSCAFGQ